MTRLGGSTKIASHAKLLPVCGAAAGTAVALGPLLGIVALSVGAEMLANHQQEAKLEAIKQVVDRLENHQLNELIAALDSADHVLEDSMAALLDRLEVPEAVGLGTTAARVKEIKALTLNWIKEWERNVAQLADKPGGVPYDNLEEALGRVGIGGFPPSGCRCSSPIVRSHSTRGPTSWRWLRPPWAGPRRPSSTSTPPSNGDWPTTATTSSAWQLCCGNLPAPA